jgi:hypothetical protein
MYLDSTPMDGPSGKLPIAGLRRIETAITRHTERRAGFTSGFDTPKQTKAM